MTDIEMGKQLLANGFTQKEVNRLKKILTHEHAGDENLQSMILDLKKRFIINCISIGMIPLSYPLIVTNHNRIEIIAYLLTSAMVLFIINLISPFKLSFKAFFFLKKKGE
ncbi:hypothetical protein [Yersinia aldovae]|uniref:hypothetical protein n=1 Tax=Yersinia aldovae TaxID=29483 RepID=UPI0021BDA27F|nr:hypothetical protein [Yersinia aldovae]